jgi:hypothetical protein
VFVCVISVVVPVFILCVPLCLFVYAISCTKVLVAVVVLVIPYTIKRSSSESSNSTYVFISK